MEWAHAIAPQAKILLVETTTDSTTNLIKGVNYARSAAGVSVVSMSWGTDEFSGQDGVRQIFHHARRSHGGHVRLGRR